MTSGLPYFRNDSSLLLVLYATTLFLLPWSWFPPFPWLHTHAQWSDITFALTALLWVTQKWRDRQWPQFHPMHLAMALYAVAAALSLLLAAPDPRLGTFKLLGICELCALALITTDLAARPRASRLIGRVIVATSLLNCVAAVAGLVLFHSGISTRLIGTYGDLVPSGWYARVQAGTYQPNMLASFCIFASAVVARGENELPRRLRRLAQAALLLTVLLTFSRGILVFGLAAAIRLARTRGQRLLAAGAVAAYVAIIVTLTIWNLSFNPARPLETRFNNDVSSSRREAIVTSWRTLADNPLFGSGIGTSPGFYRGRSFDAHLTPLSVAATMGLPALAAFAGIFFFLWRCRPRPADRTSVAVWSGLAGMALDGLAQDVEDFRHLWVLIGLAAARDGRGEACPYPASRDGRGGACPHPASLVQRID